MVSDSIVQLTFKKLPLVSSVVTKNIQKISGKLLNTVLYFNSVSV